MIEFTQVAQTMRSLAARHREPACVKIAVNGQRFGGASRLVTVSSFRLSVARQVWALVR